MDEQLARLAGLHGVAVEYWDQGGTHHAVMQETVVAVLAGLGIQAATPQQVTDALAEGELLDWRRVLPPVYVHRQSRTGRIWVHVPHGSDVVCHLVWEDGSGAQRAVQLDHIVAPREVDGVLVGEAIFEIPPGLDPGYHQFQARTADGEVHVCPLVVVPDRLPTVSPGWGLMVQLYSARSNRSWGIGDLGDLAQLAAATAAADGDFVLVNPMHAASPVTPLEPSPYLPMTRRFAHPIYLDLTDLIRAADLTSDDLNRVAAVHDRVTTENDAGLLDWDSAWTAKREVLELLYANAGPDPQFADFVHSQGVALQDFALWCALADEHGPRWREWPQQLQDVRGGAVTAEFARLEDDVLFHSWLQFQLSRQLTAVQQAAVAEGMAIGIIHDLAVGVHADGADTWRLGDLLAADVSVGAPPDMYNQRGQDWAQPPWQPEALAATAFAPYRDMLRSVLSHAGGIRVDHILGLYRQWWIPDGMSPSQGTYVSVDHEAMVGILVLEASRVGAVVIGEDLGTVEDWIRADMAERGILGTGVAWFERIDDHIRPPESWRENALASVTVHDLPPTAGYLAGEHVALRDDLGLLTETRERADAAHATEISQWRHFLTERGFLAPGADDADSLVVALHRCLAAAPARLLGVSLPDVVGDIRPQNQPGTHREYPNWCMPLSDASGRAVDVSFLADTPLWPAVTDIVAR